MNHTKAESMQSVEQTMRTLKLGGLAKEWRSVDYHDNEQYLRDPLDIEVREREANRMARMVKQANFRVIKTLDTFIWKPTIEVPATITREEIENAALVKNKGHEPLRKRASCPVLHRYRPCQHPAREVPTRRHDQLYDFPAESRAACIG
jgi:hypothetical protein